MVHPFRKARLESYYIHIYCIFILFFFFYLSGQKSFFFFYSLCAIFLKERILFFFFSTCRCFSSFFFVVFSVNRTPAADAAAPGRKKKEMKIKQEEGGIHYNLMLPSFSMDFGRVCIRLYACTALTGWIFIAPYRTCSL